MYSLGGTNHELDQPSKFITGEYGEQTAEGLIPGGKNIRVVNDNVISFIHLVVNHRLNTQIRQQSSHFLRGFQ
nr:E3 ubiquitin-protein ligase UPL6 isoform X1 [Tanacetum cinerariifolium]